MPFVVKAFIDDHALTVSLETEKEALAQAVEWHVVQRLGDISISQGSRSYSIEEFSALVAQRGLS